MSTRTRRQKNKEAGEIQVSNQMRPQNITAKTPGQQKYIDAIDNNSIIMCNGLFGTGKSTIAVAKGIEALRRGHVGKIVISRAMVVACGEEMGYLPGSSEEKLAPFMVAVMEEMHNYATKIEIENWFALEMIEIVPVALLRGRNFHESFVIIDESANLTFDQILLILTRIGRETTIVFSGDHNQCDLPYNKAGAFRTFMEILSGIPGIGMCELGRDDIVRSPFIKKILERVEDYRERQKENR